MFSASFNVNVAEVVLLSDTVISSGTFVNLTLAVSAIVAAY